jgi:hypothetical protein
MFTLDWGKALFIAALPGIGVWWLIRRKPLPSDRPFTRRPRIIEIVPAVLAIAMMIAWLFADSKFLLYGSALVSFFYLPRLVGRVFLPRRFVRTEREFFALTTLSLASHIVVYSLLALAIYAEQWLMAVILTAFIIGGTFLGAFLLRLMAHGLVDEEGNPLDAGLGEDIEGTMTTATRWPSA